jgi:hypothetical protein
MTSFAHYDIPYGFSHCCFKVWSLISFPVYSVACSIMSSLAFLYYSRCFLFQFHCCQLRLRFIKHFHPHSLILEPSPPPFSGLPSNFLQSHTIFSIFIGVCACVRGMYSTPIFTRVMFHFLCRHLHWVIFWEHILIMPPTQVLLPYILLSLSLSLSRMKLRFLLKEFHANLLSSENILQIFQFHALSSSSHA